MAITSSPYVHPNDFPLELKTIVLLHLDRSKPLRALTDSINDDGYVHFSIGIVHSLLKALDKDRLVTVRRKYDDDWWIITKQGVDLLKEQGLI